MMENVAGDPNAHLRRYADLLRAIVTRAANSPREPDGPEHSVERGIVYPLALVDREVNRMMALPPQIFNQAVADRLNHHRPAYRGLLIYSILQAIRLTGQSQNAVGIAGESIQKRLQEIPLPTIGDLPATMGDTIVETAWLALPLHLAGIMFDRPDWSGSAEVIFERISAAQTPTGPFLKASRSDNPEANWYNELLILHAITSYAVHARRDDLRERVFRNAEFHQAETQPDHATNQPWALFAFLWNPLTIPLAEQVLHASEVQNSQCHSDLTLMLWADALYSIETILK